MIKINPSIIHDRNDRYIPVKIDAYLSTFTSACRPKMGSNKKENSIQHQRQYDEHHNLSKHTLLL